MYGVVYNGEYFHRHEAEGKRLAVFKSLKYVKDGKWSYNEWEVTTKSAKLVVCMRPFGGWSDSLDECLKHIQDSSKEYTREEISRDDALVFLKGAYPKLWEHLSALEAAEEELL